MQSGAHGGSGRAERGRSVEQVKAALRSLLLALSGRPLSVAQLPHGAYPTVSNRTARVPPRAAPGWRVGSAVLLEVCQQRRPVPSTLSSSQPRHASSQARSTDTLCTLPGRHRVLPRVWRLPAGGAGLHRRSLHLPALPLAQPSRVERPDRRAPGGAVRHRCGGLPLQRRAGGAAAARHHHRRAGGCSGGEPAASARP